MKKISPIFTGKVEDSKLNIYWLDGFNKWLSQLNGKEVEIVISQKGRKRTNKQNRWYWGVAVMLITDATGQDKDSVHEFLKSECGFYEVFSFKDQEGNEYDRKLPVSTTKLLTTEFNQYKMNIQIWAGTFLGVDIPDPIDAHVTGNS